MSLDARNTLSPPEVRKIVVLRANGLGDFVFALPALWSLRAAYPRANIALAALPWHREFLARRPSPVDRVIVVPDRWEAAITEASATGVLAPHLDRFLKVMRAEDFDLAIQMHGGGRESNPFVRQFGARHSIGWREGSAERLDVSMPYVYFQSEVFRCLELAALAGAPPCALEPRIEVTAADIEEAARQLPDGDAMFVALHPGAGDGRRRWPPERFAALADALPSSVRAVLIGGSQDLEFTARTQDAAHRPVLDLAGKLSLGGLVGVLSRAAIMVGNDSGPLHLARAVGTPTVGVYWCGNLINAGSAFRTWHRPVLAWRLDCPDCGANCVTANCEHHCSFVADVAVDEVLAHVTDLLRLREATVVDSSMAASLTPAARTGA